MIFRQIFRLLILALLTTSCCCKLSVRSEYLTEASLASYHVGTPDPRRGCPLAGQQLIVSWHIPSGLWHQQRVDLDITVRFRNNQEWHQIVPCDRSLGTYIYSIQDQEFIKVGGFLTFKVLLKEDGEVTETWLHPLWQERIEL